MPRPPPLTRIPSALNHLALLQPFVAISFLRAAPQDLPASRFLLGLAVGAYLLMGALGYGLRHSIGAALLAAAAEALVLGVLVLATLNARQLGARAEQTLSALAGSGAVMTFIALPLHAWLVSAQDAETIGPAHVLTVLALTGWGLAVTAHIMRHALSAPPWVGMLLAVAYLWIIVRVMDGVFDLLGMH